jgi:hypothetical protein
MNETRDELLRTRTKDCETCKRIREDYPNACEVCSKCGHLFASKEESCRCGVRDVLMA